MEDIDVERRISLEDLQSMANAAELESVLWTSPDNVTPNPVGADNAWVCFEAEVRRANASALSRSGTTAASGAASCCGCWTSRSRPGARRSRRR